MVDEFRGERLWSTLYDGMFRGFGSQWFDRRSDVTLHDTCSLVLHLRQQVSSYFSVFIPPSLQSTFALCLRLLSIHSEATMSLFRLFRGKKWNPLRKRVDHIECSPDVLFPGSMIFMILVFLMPTTFTFYVVLALVSGCASRESFEL